MTNKRVKKYRKQVAANHGKYPWYEPILNLFRIPYELIKKAFKGSESSLWTIMFKNWPRVIASFFLILLFIGTPITTISYYWVKGPLMLKSAAEAQAVPVAMRFHQYGQHPYGIDTPQNAFDKPSVYLFKQNKQVYTKDDGSAFTEIKPTFAQGYSWDWPWGDHGGTAVHIYYSPKSLASKIEYDPSYMFVDPDDAVTGIPNTKFETTPFWISDFEGVALEADQQNLTEGVHYQWWDLDFTDPETEDLMTLKFIVGHISTNFIITVTADTRDHGEFLGGGRAWLAESAGKYRGYYNIFGTEDWFVGGSPADVKIVPQVSLHQWVVDEYESNPQIDQIGSGFLSAQITEMQSGFINYVVNDSLMEEMVGWQDYPGYLDQMSGSADVSLFDNWEDAVEGITPLDSYSEYDLDISTQLQTTVFPSLWARTKIRGFGSKTGPPDEFRVEKAYFIYQVTFKIATGYRMPFVADGEVNVVIGKSAGPPPTRNTNWFLNFAALLGIDPTRLIIILVAVVIGIVGIFVAYKVIKRKLVKKATGRDSASKVMGGTNEKLKWKLVRQQ